MVVFFGHRVLMVSDFLDFFVFLCKKKNFIFEFCIRIYKSQTNKTWKQCFLASTFDGFLHGIIHLVPCLFVLTIFWNFFQNPDTEFKTQSFSADRRVQKILKNFSSSTSTCEITWDCSMSNIFSFSHLFTNFFIFVWVFKNSKIFVFEFREQKFLNMYKKFSCFSINFWCSQLMLLFAVHLSMVQCLAAISKKFYK